MQIFAPESAKFAHIRQILYLCSRKNAIIMKNVITIAAILAGCFAIAAIMGSCNVTRTITNESQYFQRGDTSVVIQTKTIETYDAKRKY